MLSRLMEPGRAALTRSPHCGHVHQGHVRSLAATRHLHKDNLILDISTFSSIWKFMNLEKEEFERWLSEQCVCYRSMGPRLRSLMPS